MGGGCRVEAKRGNPEKIGEKDDMMGEKRRYHGVEEGDVETGTREKGEKKKGGTLSQGKESK